VYQVRILDEASRELERLDKPIAQRIVERLRWLGTNVGRIKLQALAGDLAGFYKFRVGDYRIIYEIIDAEQTILIHVIGHRREIYRRR
jgi:mRNA interferase RelE/StbE